MLRRLFAFMIGAALLGGSVVAEADGKLELRVILNDDFDITNPGSSARGA